jgi:hypothetical protein
MDTAATGSQSLFALGRLQPGRLPMRRDRAKATALILFGREVVTFSWRK